MIEEKENKPEAKVKDVAPTQETKSAALPALLGQKIGMTQIFEGSGVVPVTVIKAGPCFITQIKTVKNDGYNAVQVGFGSRKKITKPLEDKKFRYLREFRMDKLEGIELGAKVGADIFTVGEKVKVSGRSIGKGFAGTVKKHHFNRGPMAHGSKSHRIRGSSSSGTSPGRVRKGTRMAAHMGAITVSVKNLVVVRVEPESDLILVRGAVPGKENGFLTIRKI
jgi:large subunit ribosomal protein L3